ncbi:MAG: DUF5698 domain-containing protein [Cyclobacteriaceae bacterium]|nr:hypothetical protein [Cyclobacteriaceae bacterium]MCB0498695.1 hypothetical protein [Cyclobacteriaceae bacterium]MCB9237793.1 hypothetical protein [Flammeovirgaceae bacterium]MCO5270104.1 DUF5698 domain-containing protein [Cyclobacteriaceae bacterium]MCW5903156.1 hypothetical protein [Cyclobacteriaceae bacterium]
MDTFFIETLGFSDAVFGFVILPLLIFIARICDVSINTVRIIYMLGGRRLASTALGFFEAFIWLMAIRQIFAHLDNWMSYIAYPAGFAGGIFVGMIIEEKIAYGKVVVRIITRKDTLGFINFLKLEKIRYTCLKSFGPDGEEDVIFCVLDRERVESLLSGLKKTVPTAFYTIEGVKAAKESGVLPEPGARMPFFSRLRSVIRS